MSDKPNLPLVLFWEYKFETIKWRKHAVMVIERVLDRGNEEEIEEIIRFYGLDKVLDVLKNETIFLMDPSLARACIYFNLKPEELKCYNMFQLKGKHWPFEVDFSKWPPETWTFLD